MLTTFKRRGRAGRPGTSAPPKCEGPRGFTLVEMLVAMIITGILAAGVIGLLLRQNEFYGETDDLVFAEQSLRATADLVSSELRMASPLDVVEATPARVTVEFDVVRAVVCAVNTTSNSVFYYVVDEAVNANMGPISGVAYRNPYSSGGYAWDRSYTLPSDAATATGAGHTIAQTCFTSGGPDPTQTDPTNFRLIPTWNAGIPLPSDGAYLRFFGRLTYEFKPSSFGSGTGLFRGTQELASPFDSDAAFSYVMSGGGVQNNVGTGNYQNIREIRVSATALGDGANRHDVARDLSYDIPLRNRSD